MNAQGSNQSLTSVCDFPFQPKLFNDFIRPDEHNLSETEYVHKGYKVNNHPVQFENSSVKAMSFFSGAGGLDIGAQLAGVKVISSLDFDKDAYSTMRSNEFFAHTAHFCKDINNFSANDYGRVIKASNPEKLIFVGGPPCQPFSKAGYWVTNKNRQGKDDPRNMIGSYLRVIEEVKPDGFILENVESILHPTNKSAVEDLKESVEQLGYNLESIKANAIDYGVPQKRKRVFFVASRKKFRGSPEKTHGSEKEIKINPNLNPHEKVIDWIGKFNIDEFSDGYDSAEGKYYDDLLKVPPGENYIALTEKRGYPNPKFISGKRYWTFLLKLHPLKPSWTIIAAPGHWEGPFHWTSRRLRIKEIAAIQTFPEDYQFYGSRRSIQKQIGNAVPSLLGKKIVEFLIKNI